MFFFFNYLFVDLCWLVGECNSEHHIFRKSYSNILFFGLFLLQMPITVYVPKTKSFIWREDQGATKEAYLHTTAKC